ncbi:MAG: hypothetical protein M1587_08580 [Thaumarchaeota archaeon]|nr:hypothetical protein [Nitrososphaerota archaeon]MCL5068233.1 hypothetical protein [Nitrososphaerota archaeon]
MVYRRRSRNGETEIVTASALKKGDLVAWESEHLTVERRKSFYGLVDKLDPDLSRWLKRLEKIGNYSDHFDLAVKRIEEHSEFQDLLREIYLRMRKRKTQATIANWLDPDHHPLLPRPQSDLGILAKALDSIADDFAIRVRTFTNILRNMSNNTEEANGLRSLAYVVRKIRGRHSSTGRHIRAKDEKWQKSHRRTTRTKRKHPPSNSTRERRPPLDLIYKRAEREYRKWLMRQPSQTEKEWAIVRSPLKRVLGGKGSTKSEGTTTVRSFKAGPIPVADPKKIPAFLIARKKRTGVPSARKRSQRIIHHRRTIREEDDYEDEDYESFYSDSIPDSLDSKGEAKENSVVPVLPNALVNSNSIDLIVKDSCTVLIDLNTRVTLSWEYNLGNNDWHVMFDQQHEIGIMLLQRRSEMTKDGPSYGWPIIAIHGLGNRIPYQFDDYWSLATALRHASRECYQLWAFTNFPVTRDLFSYTEKACQGFPPQSVVFCLVELGKDSAKRLFTDIVTNQATNLMSKQPSGVFIYDFAPEGFTLSPLEKTTQLPEPNGQMKTSETGTATHLVAKWVLENAKQLSDPQQWRTAIVREMDSNHISTQRATECLNELLANIDKDVIAYQAMVPEDPEAGRSALFISDLKARRDLFIKAKELLLL